MYRSDLGVWGGVSLLRHVLLEGKSMLHSFFNYTFYFAIVENKSYSCIIYPVSLTGNILRKMLNVGKQIKHLNAIYVNTHTQI